MRRPRVSGSAMIAVHSTSNRNVALPRTYQMQSVFSSAAGSPALISGR
jgi:hypothetical protein